MCRAWMLEHLAQQTQQHHASADGARLAIMERPSPARYRAYLARIHCFEAAIEAAWAATEGLDRSLLLTYRKTDKLVSDLEALGLGTCEIATTTRLRFACPAEALGWMWVIHRNTLFHGLVYRYLACRFVEVMRVAGAYLSAFEGRAGALMGQLGHALDAAARRPAAESRIASAANEAFRMQRQWYSGDLVWPSPQLSALAVKRAPGVAA